MQSCRCGPSPFNISYNRSAHLPFKRFERSLIIFDVSLSTLKQSGSGFLHSLSLEKYFSFFLCLKTKTKCLALYSYHPRARNAFYHYKKKGRIKGCLWVCLQGHPFCLAGRGDACGVKLLYDSLLKRKEHRFSREDV